MVKRNNLIHDVESCFKDVFFAKNSAKATHISFAAWALEPAKCMGKSIYPIL